MPRDLTGHVAVVTGGGSGIGECVSRLLASRGVHCIVADVNEAAASRVASEVTTATAVRSIGVLCDVTDAKQVQNAIDEAIKSFGRFDIMINNAGIGEKGHYSYPHAEQRDWQNVIDIDLTAVIVGTRLAVLAMQRQQCSGVIVNTASMGGLVPMPSTPIYAAAKAGVVHFTRSMAWLTDGIRVNAVCPSFAATPLVLAQGEDNVKAMSQLVGGILDPNEIAIGMLELIDDEQRNGAIMRITVEGGRDFWPKRKPKKFALEVKPTQSKL